MLDFDVNDASFNRLMRLLVPDLYAEPIRGALQKVALIGEREARIKAKPHQVDTGETARAIESQVGGSGTALWAKVYTKQAEEVAFAIEYGRKPGGRLPPPEPIAAWARRHGVGVPTFVLQRSIARKGTKGLFFMRAGRAAAQGAIPQALQDAFRSIQSSWRF